MTLTKLNNLVIDFFTHSINWKKSITIDYLFKNTFSYEVKPKYESDKKIN